MLKEAEKIGCDELAHYASKHFIQNPISYGQDKENGGLFYFLDVDGKYKRSINIYIIDCHYLLLFMLVGLLIAMSYLSHMNIVNYISYVKDNK